jgi:hypothetical protein
VGLNLLKSLNLTNVYPNNKSNKKNNKVKSKPLELFELVGKKKIYCCNLILAAWQQQQQHRHKKAENCPNSP